MSSTRYSNLLVPGGRQGYNGGMFGEWSVPILVLHAAGGVLALHALARPHSPQGTLAWMLALLLLPMVAIPIYLLLNAHTMRLRRGGRRKMGGGQGGVPALLPAVAACTGMPASAGNEVRLLPNGRCAYRSIARAVAHARLSVSVEFYIIRNDRVGASMRRMLIDCAQRGVKTRVIYDEIGCRRLPMGYLRQLREGGVEVAAFNGRRFLLSSLMRLNYRNHRKLVVVDGETAYIGSANIGQEYLHRRPPWRDAFVRVRGPAAAQAMQCFADDWRCAAGKRPDTPPHVRERGHARCQLVPSGPYRNGCNAWQMCLVEMAARARRRLWLSSPYLVPTQAVVSALQAAALRGVEVRLLVPKRGDSRLAALALLSFLPELEACGVRVFAYTPGFLHEKVGLVDSELCSIGTANLDERSMNLNFELTLLCFDSALVSRVERMLARDMAAAVPLCAEHFLHRSFPARLPAYAARLLAPIL